MNTAAPASRTAALNSTLSSFDSLGSGPKTKPSGGSVSVWLSSTIVSSTVCQRVPF
ncbi:uncharacterized protein METZ01_LOCUS303200, partial [marine metagenome]